MDSTGFPTLNDIPEYAAAVAKLDQVRQKRDELAGIIERSKQALRKRPGVGAPGLNAAAAAVLEGRPVPDKGELRTDLDEAQYEHSVLEQAFLLQEKAVANAKQAGAAKIADKMRPAHKAVARKIREALAALVVALKEEREFNDQAERRDLPGTFPQIFFHVPGSSPRETIQAAEQWLKDQAGYLR